MQTMEAHEVEAMLDQTRIGRLCMADAQGRPYAIPLPFTWFDGALYLRLPLTGRKGEILAQNNRVCFEIDSYTDTLDDYASVLIEGVLEEVTTTEEKAMVRGRTQEKYQRLRRGHRPGHGRSTPLESLALRRIVVDQISGRRKERATVAATS
jgi:nitroimidazol reductase NimA-like FMN-containing flavoprotein (pyridoxamine 5'-phosphate oxidase superfamily)